MSELEEAKFFYEFVLGLYRDTRGSNDLLNQKIHNMLTVTVTATLILTGLYNYVLSIAQRRVALLTYRVITVPIVLGLSFLFVSILLGIYSYRSYTIKGFDSKSFADKHYGAGLLNALENAISNLISMTEENQTRLEKKAKFYHVTLVLMTLGIFSLVLSFVTLVAIN